MNIENGLEEKIRPISANNCLTLSLEERLKLETLLDQLKSDIKSDEMLFWGKIMGAEKDYYIAEALYYKNQNIFPKKKFYFCNNATFVFSELPDIQEHHLNDFSKFNSYFVGNPDIILAKYEDNTPLNTDIENNNEDTFKPIIKKKNLTEGDRLSFVVRSIEHDCQIVPIGGFKMLPINELRRNDLFEGLSCDNLGKLECYAHFRKMENEEKKDMIVMGKAVFDFNFLDSIKENSINGSWSIHVDSAKTISNIRSLIWPGYFAYAKANTNEFGGLYIGYGIKNVDIPFMQQ